jgi:hypothetical protein
MHHAAEHDWLVVAPWWHWGSPPRADVGRLSRPAIQKYDTSDLVNVFLQDPQRRLRFTLDDLVYVTTNLGPAPTDSDGKPRRIGNRRSVPLEPPMRKLFLDTHKRFYLVVCQVHCDAPGFPRVARSKISEAGFVVRRRTTTLPSASVKAARRALSELGSARLQQKKIEEAFRALRDGGKIESPKVKQAKIAALHARRQSVLARIEAEKARLREIAAYFGITPDLQGWFPSPSGADKVGFWDTVEETPKDLEQEVTYPLYPLVPPDDAADHDARHGTIYFGLLPTGSAETTAEGHARFDDRTQYEVRCFVKRRGEPQCPDEIFWSAPTEPYRLAAHFDLTGTSQRPVTVQLPDLKELEAQAGPKLGAIFVKPPGSLMVAGNAEGGIDAASRSGPGFEICSIPIPLITIVAMFVFELFLPVVMLLFGLFWMLRLKFCIPPQIDVAAGVTAELSLNASANASVALEMSANVTNAFPPTTLPGVVVPEAPPALPIPSDRQAEIARKLKGAYSPVALANLAFFEKQAGDEVLGASLTRGLQWVERVEYS